ncbi:MAG: cupin domain-containing protein [Pseudomonadota bacterium]
MDAAASDASAMPLAERLVRYGDLRPCTTAFIDTRTPGSAEKENFTIIGPGVAENPDQHVHIEIPHGFNIGGARQPPGCVNSQHSHETAEVFVVHSGTWAFMLGADGHDGRVILEEGDTISIPIHVFRGFENVGPEAGFLFAVLGGDDPGRVTWAPYVFEQASTYGLVLMEDGSLVDTANGESIPAGKKPMPATTDADVAALRRMSGDELNRCVVRQAELATALQPGPAGYAERPIIGAANAAEQLSAGRMAWPHGFHLRFAHFSGGEVSTEHVRHEEEVLLLQCGELNVRTPAGTVLMRAGDVLTLPIGMPRCFANNADRPVDLYIVRGGDSPAAPDIVSP